MNQKKMSYLLSGEFWNGKENLHRGVHERVAEDPLVEISNLLGKELSQAEEEFFEDVIFLIATSNMNMRWAQQGQPDSGIDDLVAANAIEEIIHLSPKWGGSELYRGMVGEQYDINELYKSFQSNTPINMMGMSSWSDDYEIEDSYAASPKGKAGISIMYTLPKTNKGTSVNVCNGTKEVVISGTADFMVEDISQDNTGRYNVSLKEI